MEGVLQGVLSWLVAVPLAFFISQPLARLLGQTMLEIDLDFAFNPDPRHKKPNYKGFYEENTFKSFYKESPNSEHIIKKAHKLRNANPISHSSSGLIDKDNTSAELNRCIDDLSYLIFDYIKAHKKQI